MPGMKNDLCIAWLETMSRDNWLEIDGILGGRRHSLPLRAEIIKNGRFPRFFRCYGRCNKNS